MKKYKIKKLLVFFLIILNISALIISTENYSKEEFLDFEEEVVNEESREEDSDLTYLIGLSITMFFCIFVAIAFFCIKNKNTNKKTLLKNEENNLLLDNNNETKLEDNSILEQSVQFYKSSAASQSETKNQLEKKPEPLILFSKKFVGLEKKQEFLQRISKVLNEESSSFRHSSENFETLKQGGKLQTFLSRKQLEKVLAKQEQEEEKIKFLFNDNETKRFYVTINVKQKSESYQDKITQLKDTRLRTTWFFRIFPLIGRKNDTLVL